MSPLMNDVRLPSTNTTICADRGSCAAFPPPTSTSDRPESLFISPLPVSCVVDRHWILFASLRGSDGHQAQITTTHSMTRTCSLPADGRCRCHLKEKTARMTQHCLPQCVGEWQRGTVHPAVSSMGSVGHAAGCFEPQLRPCHGTAQRIQQCKVAVRRIFHTCTRWERVWSKGYDAGARCRHRWIHTIISPATPARSRGQSQADSWLASRPVQPKSSICGATKSCFPIQGHNESLLFVGSMVCQILP